MKCSRKNQIALRAVMTKVDRMNTREAVSVPSGANANNVGDVVGPGVCCVTTDDEMPSSRSNDATSRDPSLARLLARTASWIASSWLSMAAMMPSRRSFTAAASSDDAASPPCFCCW